VVVTTFAFFGRVTFQQNMSLGMPFFRFSICVKGNY